MSIRTSIARIGPDGQVLLSNGSRHDDAAAAIRAVLRAVEARTAPAGADVVVTFVRPAAMRRRDCGDTY